MSTIAMMFLAVTQTLSLPPNLLKSICFVESGHKTHVVHYNDGIGNSVGVCQIKYATAQTLGYKGTEAQLLSPKTNIFWAGMYLSKQLKRYQGDIPKAVAAYNAGTARIKPNGLIVNRKYVSKVYKIWIAGI